MNEDATKRGEPFNLTFSDDEAGKAFAEAVVKIVNRKQGRNNLYKDNWYDRNRITYHTDRIDSKAGRIKQAEDNFFAGKISLRELMDILEEEAGDVAVYSLFVMAKLEKLKVVIANNDPDYERQSVALYLTEKMGGDDEET
jgi:hypothetical protein